MPAKNFLAATHPDIHAELHPTRNGDLDLTMVATFSNKKVWWLHADERGDLHEWQQIVRNRTYDGTGCLTCANRTRPPVDFPIPLPHLSLADVGPELATWWHATRNGDLTPGDVMPFSSRRVWWQCPEGHEFTAQIQHRWGVYALCPGCRPRVGARKPKSGTTLVDAFPDVAAEWDMEKNQDLGGDPSTVGYCSNLKAWWRCEEGHSWRTHVHLRTTGGTKCAKCVAVARRGQPNLAGKHGSLAERYPNVAAQWHTGKNVETPMEVTSCSPRLFWWRCPAGHEWEQSVNHRVTRGDKPVCWACARPIKTIPGDLVHEGQESLADAFPGVAAWWHPSRNGHLKPGDVKPRARCRVWWKCGAGHAFQATPASRVGSGSGCRKCANTEERNLRPDVRLKEESRAAA